MKFLLSILLLVGACGPDSKGYVPTWDSEDLVGFWRLTHTSDLGEVDSIYVEFSDERGSYFAIEVAHVWNSDWRRIGIRPSKGDITTDGMVEFNIDFKDYKWNFACYEGAMDENKLLITGVCTYWRGSDETVSENLTIFVAERL